MARSLLEGILGRGGWVMVALCTSVAAPAFGQRQSSIVENYDHSGTTVVKVVEAAPDAVQEWTIFNSWQKNEVNGAVRYEDGSSDFLNCTPQRRTNDFFELACRLYAQESELWSTDPIVVENSTAFLNGPYVNVYNDLFSLPGEYTTTIEFPGFSESYRLRMLDAAQSGAGFPFLLVATNPPVLQSFLFRNTDLPEGTTELTNFTLGIQTVDYCIDLDLNPVAPGGTLAGTFGARENEGGECGALVAENRSIAVTPSGPEGVAGTYCRYVVDEVGTCAGDPGPGVGSSICLPCAGICRSFDGAFFVLFKEANLFAVCEDVRVSPAEDQACDQSCDGLDVLQLVQTGESQGLTRLSAARSAR